MSQPYSASKIKIPHLDRWCMWPAATDSYQLSMSSQQLEPRSAAIRRTLASRTCARESFGMMSHEFESPNYLVFSHVSDFLIKKAVNQIHISGRKTGVFFRFSVPGALCSSAMMAWNTACFPSLQDLNFKQQIAPIEPVEAPTRL